MTGKTDRELLELAAKAAGIKKGAPFGGREYFIRPGCEFQEWLPSIDDVDAMRLACRLKMDLSFGHAQFTATWFDEDLSETHDYHEYCHDSDESERSHATRRAIVRAAAAIGEKMP